MVQTPWSASRKALSVTGQFSVVSSAVNQWVRMATAALTMNVDHERSPSDSCERGK